MNEKKCVTRAFVDTESENSFGKFVVLLTQNTDIGRSFHEFIPEKKLAATMPHEQLVS